MGTAIIVNSDYSANNIGKVTFKKKSDPTIYTFDFDGNGDNLVKQENVSVENGVYRIEINEYTHESTGSGNAYMAICDKSILTKTNNQRIWNKGQESAADLGYNRYIYITTGIISVGIRAEVGQKASVTLTKIDNEIAEGVIFGNGDTLTNIDTALHLGVGTYKFITNRWDNNQCGGNARIVIFDGENEQGTLLVAENNITGTVYTNEMTTTLRIVSGNAFVRVRANIDAEAHVVFFKES